jgi:hexosaminidase
LYEIAFVITSVPLSSNIPLNTMHMTHHEFRIRFVLPIFFLVSMFPSFSQVPEIIPLPAEIIPEIGAFTLTDNAKIYLSNESQLKAVANYFLERVNAQSPRGLTLDHDIKNCSVHLLLNEKKEQALGAEGYRLKITPQAIVLTANTAAGIFYGVQTLLQCLPKEIENNARKNPDNWIIAALSITDYPRFAWRGIMLDVSRHFFSKEYVKNYIDQIARYKYNRLHLHLTDDNGWRIEIKSLPLLTTEGAWRVPRTGTFGSNEAPKPGEKPTYGGFYTQDDMREIIAFAKERFIEILPEIDVPGHSMAAIAAYPLLSVTKDTATRVNPGSNFSTWFGNGKFEMHIDNTLNPTDEKVYDFLDKVITEIAAIFPFEYIHMGGDECYKGYWERDAAVQAFMKKNKLKDGHALQAYFTSRVNKIVQSKKKKMIGWDEILEGGELTTDAAVMSWQGTKGGIAASKRQHTVVMSPAPHYYLDMGQGEPSIEPPIYNIARLKDVYHFNIVPAEADSTYVIGGQGNLWTEQIPTTAQLEYMTYPRALAISETLWTPSKKKEWNSFVIRTEKHLQRLDERQINYATSFYDPIITVSKNKLGNLVIELRSEVDTLDLFYTLDNSLPNKYYSRYNGPIELSPDVDNFKVISYRDNKPVGRLIVLKREELTKRLKK